MLEDGITLITSDSRPKYANDALAVLAMPPGCRYQFRYDSSYVPTAIRNLIAHDIRESCPVLVAYREEVSGSQPDDQIIVPIRWATLGSVEMVADFYIFRFLCRGYPSFRGGQSPRNRSELLRLVAAYKREYGATEWNLPVHSGLTSMVEFPAKENEERDTWIWIARALSWSQPFSRTQFLRVGRITGSRHNAAELTSEGYAELTEGEYATVAIDHYATDYMTQAQLSVTTDSSLLRVASGTQRALDSRYDSIHVLAQALPKSGDSRTEIEIRTTDSDGGATQTCVRIPVTIKRALGWITLRSGIVVCGGVLLAAPGLLGQSASLSLKLVLTAIGAVLLAVTNFLPPTSQ